MPCVISEDIYQVLHQSRLHNSRKNKQDIIFFIDFKFYLMSTWVYSVVLDNVLISCPTVKALLVCWKTIKKLCKCWIPPVINVEAMCFRDGGHVEARPWDGHPIQEAALRVLRPLGATATAVPLPRVLRHQRPGQVRSSPPPCDVFRGSCLLLMFAFMVTEMDRSMGVVSL